MNSLSFFYAVYLAFVIANQPKADVAISKTYGNNGLKRL